MIFHWVVNSIFVFLVLALISELSIFAFKIKNRRPPLYLPLPSPPEASLRAVRFSIYEFLDVLSNYCTGH